MRVGTGSHASCCMGWQEKARQCCNKPRLEDLLPCFGLDAGTVSRTRQFRRTNLRQPLSSLFLSSLPCFSAAQSLAHAMQNVCCMLVASPRLPIDGLGRTALPAHPRSGFEPETIPFQTRILDWDIGFDCRDCRDERRRFRNEDEVSVGDEVAACCGEFARRRSASCTSIRIEMVKEGKLLVCVPSWKPMEGRRRLCDRR